MKSHTTDRFWNCYKDLYPKAFRKERKRLTGYSLKTTSIQAFDLKK